MTQAIFLIASLQYTYILFSKVLFLTFPGVSIPEELSQQTFLVGELLLPSQGSPVSLADFDK